jgi:hypothetical protein
MRRRAFLELLAAAPIAALAPWRPQAFAGVDVAAGESYTAWVHWYRGQIVQVFGIPAELLSSSSVGTMAEELARLDGAVEGELLRIRSQAVARLVNPPVVLRDDEVVWGGDPEAVASITRVMERRIREASR